MKASREIALLRATLLGAGRTRTVLYRAAAGTSGLIVQCDVYRPDRTKDEAQSGTATEIDSTGSYHFTFVTDGPGYFVLVSDSAGGGAVKTYD